MARVGLKLPRVQMEHPPPPWTSSTELHLRVLQGLLLEWKVAFISGNTSVTPIKKWSIMGNINLQHSNLEVLQEATTCNVKSVL